MIYIIAEQAFWKDQAQRKEEIQAISKALIIQK
jgi:hypothetical protein